MELNESLLWEEFNRLLEDTGKTAVVAFGRVNPPTIGHQKLVDKLKEVANKVHGEPMLFLSHTCKPDKNPLTYESKLKWCQKAFGDIVKESTSKEYNIFHVLPILYREGYDNLIVVTGDDRKDAYNEFVLRNNGKEVENPDDFYKFNSIEIISAGARDEDADDASGASASKARQFAKDGDFESFSKIVPFERNEAHNLYSEVRKGLNLDNRIKEVLNRHMGDVNELLEELHKLVEDDESTFKKKRSLSSANSFEDAYNILRKELVTGGASEETMIQFNSAVHDIETITNTIDLNTLKELSNRLSEARAPYSASQFIKVFGPTQKSIKELVVGKKLNMPGHNDISGMFEDDPEFKSKLVNIKDFKNTSAKSGTYELFIALAYEGGKVGSANNPNVGDSSVKGHTIEVKAINNHAAVGAEVHPREVADFWYWIRETTGTQIKSFHVDSFDGNKQLEKIDVKKLPDSVRKLLSLSSGTISYRDLYTKLFTSVVDGYIVSGEDGISFEYFAPCAGDDILVLKADKSLANLLLQNCTVTLEPYQANRVFSIKKKGRN